MRTRLISSGFVAAVVAASVPASAAHVTRERVPIAVGAGGQFDPSIKGSSIAYTDTSIAANGADIVVYDIADGATAVRITGTGGAQEVEDIDGTYVVFRQWNTTTETEGEIFVYNLATGGYTQITDDTTQQRDPAISGTRIVWVDVATSTIWMANVDGSGMRAVAPGGFQSAPAIDGNLVVWVENGSIVAYDLSNEAAGKQVIASGSAPDVRGGKIVWASGGNIWLKSGAASPVQLTSDAETQRNPKVSDTMAAWEHVSASGDVDVHAWDFRTSGIEALASGAGSQELHDLDGTNLAYTDRGNDAEGDIYLIREVADDPEPAPVDDPCAEDAPVDVLYAGEFVRSTGAPQWVSGSFSSQGNDHATVCVTAYGVSSARVQLNGDALLGPSDFHNEDVATFEIEAELEASNELCVKLAGTPGSTMNVRVVVPSAALSAHAADASEGLGGCRVAPAQGSPAGLLALVGLAFFRRRRV